jgi:transposase InsO family protein
MAQGEFFHTKRILPKSILYNAQMKTLANSLQYADHDPSQFRLHVLKHGKRYGVQAAVEAFGISRRTYFVWQMKLKNSQGKLVSLIPRSTRPKHMRTMRVDARLLELIKSLREQYGRIGKEKLAILVDAYARELGIESYSASKIGKIIKRYRYFFERRKLKYKSKASRERTKRSPKGAPLGYLQMDSVHVWLHTQKLIFITIIDVATRVAYASRVKTSSSEMAKRVLCAFQAHYTTQIHTIQTDNGSEFLGAFHHYLEEKTIKHVFSYPRSPQVNGYIERFNRTLQEEFVTRCDYWSFDLVKADDKLVKYLEWYNTKRPHASLKYQPPLVYLQQIT